MTMFKLLVVCLSLTLLVLITPTEVVGELVSTPLWEARGNASQMCSLSSNNQDHSIILHGSSSTLCSLHVSTAASSLVIHVPGNLTDDYQLYVERNGLPETCSGRYVSIRGIGDDCEVVSFEGNITLHLNGDLDVQIKEESRRQQSSSSQCPNVNGHHYDNYDNSTLSSCDVSEYNNVLTCTNQGDVLCSLVFPSNCTANVRYREVALNCSVYYVTQEKSAILLYPNPMIQLNLTSNKIIEIDENAFREFHQLQILYLQLNQIETLKPGVFDGLTNLLHLSLASNLLITLEPGLFTDLQMLSVLDLSSNQLTTIDHPAFQTLTNLSELLLESNRIHTLDPSAFRGLSNLEVLTLRYNHLVTLHEDVFANLTNLYDLVIGDNRLVKLDKPGLFRDLGKLYKLNVGRNWVLSSYHVDLFQNLTNLHELRTFRNAIKHWPGGLFRNLKNLRVLSMYNNTFSTLGSDTFIGLINTEELNLGLNRVERFPPNIFGEMVKLRTLYLDQNRLKDIQKELFAPLKNLNRLTLNLNQLRRIDSEVFLDTTNITDLDLSDNDLVGVPDFSNLRRLSFLKLQNNELVAISGKSFSGLNEGVNLYVSQHEICECYVPSNFNCSGSGTRSPYLTCDRLLSDRVLVGMMWLIGLNALGGNAFVLYYTKKYNRSKIQSFLLSNLALSDLLMGLYMVLIAITDIYFGDGFPMQAENWRTGPTCKFAGALAITSSESSVFFVTLISVDRFFSIKYPHSSLRFNRVSIKVAGSVLWIIALVLGIVPSVLAGQNPDFYDNSHVCIGLPLAVTELYTQYTSTKRIASKYRPISVDITRSVPSGQISHMYFSTAVFLGLNCCCYFLVACCYISLMRTVYQSSKRVNLNKDMKVQIRLTLKVAAIVATDFLCWFPIIVLGILVQSGALVLPPSVFAWAITFVLPINSAINPYLYTIADVISKRRKRLVGDGGSAVDSRTDQPGSNMSNVDSGQENPNNNSTFIVVKPGANTVTTDVDTRENTHNSNV